MAQAKKKFSRKDMKKPDEFLQKSWEFSEWAGQHSRQILIVTGIVVGSILVGAFLWSYGESRQIKSSRQLEGVFKVVDRDIVPTEFGAGAMGAQGEDEPFGSKYHKDEALLKAYREARDNAKTGEVKKASTLGMASALLGLGKYEEAGREFGTLASDPSGMGDMLHSIYEGLGFAYEGMGKMDKALEQYKKLEKCEGSAYKELGLFHQARLLEGQGKGDEARKLYNDVAASINKAEEMTPLLAYLQEKISGKEGVDLGPAMFKSPGPGPAGPMGGELTPEKLEELKKKLEEMKKMQDLEAAAKEQAEGIAEALEGKGGEETVGEGAEGEPPKPEKAPVPQKGLVPQKGSAPEKGSAPGKGKAPAKGPAPEKAPAGEPEAGGGEEGEGGE